MRPPEPLKLTRDDIDFRTHAITIRETKFSKSRVIVVHPTATQALQAYARRRDRHVRKPRSPAFFLLDDGTSLTHKKALWAFRHLRHQLGWQAQPGRRLPRLYDLRHTFVCRRLLAWYREGVDVHVAISWLSTYLGHVKVTDTYWYMTGIPELMAVVGSRFEQFVCGDDGGHR
jgi:integrase